MLVWEKQKDIHVLKALGRTMEGSNDILKRGILLALLGGGCGILLAVFICWLQSTYHLCRCRAVHSSSITIPVKLVPTDFLLVLSTIIIVHYLHPGYPPEKLRIPLLNLDKKS